MNLSLFIPCAPPALSHAGEKVVWRSRDVGLCFVKDMSEHFMFIVARWCNFSQRGLLCKVRWHSQVGNGGCNFSLLVWGSEQKWIKLCMGHESHLKQLGFHFCHPSCDLHSGTCFSICALSGQLFKLQGRAGGHWQCTKFPGWESLNLCRIL